MIEARVMLALMLVGAGAMCAGLFAGFWLAIYLHEHEERFIEDCGLLEGCMRFAGMSITVVTMIPVFLMLAVAVLSENMRRTWRCM